MPEEEICEHVLVLRADEGAGELSGLPRQRVPITPLPPRLDRVVLQRRALAVALLRDADHLLALRGDAEHHHLVVLGQTHPDHAGGLPPHGSNEAPP